MKKIRIALVAMGVMTCVTAHASLGIAATLMFNQPVQLLALAGAVILSTFLQTDEGQWF